jgi:SAM-dependent methyltransferase
MEYRKVIESTPDLAAWYDAKYLAMGDGWHTPATECNQHLDDLGVPFNKLLRLLDVGCGAGHFLAEATKRVTCFGSEISGIGAIKARARAPQAAIAQVSIEERDYWISTGGRFDYVVSLGSLEHIVNLDAALANIRELLGASGKFYFLCPNERWKHFDQPNERTMTDWEWMALFEKYGLHTSSIRRWNDSTAFIGSTQPLKRDIESFHPHGTKLNCGSGQRPFDRGQGWINIDIQAQWEPDICGTWDDLTHYFHDSTMDLVVAHHTLEHVWGDHATGFMKQAWQVLKPGGSLLVFVPNMQSLAQRWLMHQIDDATYFTNVYGAFMGDEADRHKWGFTWKSLTTQLQAAASWQYVKGFDWRPVAGADIARDWWILGMEAVK